MSVKAFDKHSTQAREDYFRNRGRKAEKRQSNKNDRRAFQRDVKSNWG